MITTIIPAQITTVEDKIAGSLNMTQILILMFPVLWTAFIYTLAYPSMKLVPYKMVLILFVVAICLILSLRIKEKIVAEWLEVVFKYHARPRYWLYNKNDVTSRIIDVPGIPNIAVTPKRSIKKITKSLNEVNVADLMKLEHLINSGKVAVRYQFDNKHI